MKPGRLPGLQPVQVHGATLGLMLFTAWSRGCPSQGPVCVHTSVGSCGLPASRSGGEHHTEMCWALCPPPRSMQLVEVIPSLGQKLAPGVVSLVISGPGCAGLSGAHQVHVASRQDPP